MSPLSGVRVVELARILAGPWIGQTLADLGADVIKVEAPEGDDTRRWGPPFIETNGERAAAYFHACNRGKRGIVADFATPRGREIVLRLVTRADVLIENFKVGGLKKYGLDYRVPEPPQSGFDLLLGHRLRPDRPLRGARRLRLPDAGPVRVHGHHRRAGRPAAARRRRDQRPLHRPLRRRGRRSGADRAGANGARPAARPSSPRHDRRDPGQPSDELPRERRPAAAHRDRHPNLAPYQAFPVADGWIIIAVGNDGQFARLCSSLGLDRLASDARYATNPARNVNRALLAEEISAATRSWKHDVLLAALEKAVVPAGPINTIADLFADPQFIARGMRIDPQQTPGLRSPIVMSESTLALERRSPTLGEHQAEVLQRNRTRRTGTAAALTGFAGRRQIRRESMRSA